ncbi:hypothetical protein TNCV_4054091 [Trichonephila clavipes]|nr:hypothetical protein TNCV_4054091 [Trichonephila clavipes]
MYRDVVTTQTDLVVRLHHACTSVDIVLLRRVNSSLSLLSQARLDMHREHFEHLSLKIFTNTAVDVFNMAVTS